MDNIASLILGVAMLLIAIGGILDLLYYRLPNFIFYLLFLLFPIWALFKGDSEILFSYLPFLGLLVIGFGLFIFEFMGGGDVKFLAVCGLWAGWDGVIPLLIWMALIGGVVALLFIRSSTFFNYATARGRTFVRSQSWLLSGVLFLIPDVDQLEERIIMMQEKRKIPYGIAVSMAALLVLGGVVG